MRKSDYSFWYKCRAKCAPGKGCKFRKCGKYTWAELRKICPKLEEKQPAAKAAG